MDGEVIKEKKEEVVETPPKNDKPDMDGGNESVSLKILAALKDLIGLGGVPQSDAPVVPEPGGNIEARLEKIEAALVKLLPVEEEEHGETFDQKTAIDEISGQMKMLEDSIGKLLSASPTGKPANVPDVEKNLGDADPNDELVFERGDGEEEILGDSKTCGDMDKEIILEGAETLDPDVEIPEGDSDAVMKSLIVNSLITGSKRNKTVAGIVGAVIGDKGRRSDVAKLEQPVLQTLFQSAVSAVRATNNMDTVNGLGRLAFGDKKPVEAPVLTGRDLQAIADKAYGRV